MNVHLPRAKLERFGRLLAEYQRRKARAEQAARGWYDEHGIRQGGLIAFVRHFWRVLEPETDLVDGWPLWAMCEHLEAVTFGEITRLLINVPPGFMKSLLVDVFWPAWEWGPQGLAHLRYIAFSYASTLTERDNGRFRDLITSDAYRQLWGHKVDVVRGARASAIRVSNSKRGWKFASSVQGVGTGERGDRIILDDPHNVKESESETIRAETVRWFREAMSNRLNDLERGVIVIIMQRVHEDDVSGVILSEGLDYCHLMIPMEYDVARQTRDDGTPRVTAASWTDPRYNPDDPDAGEGELAWEDRFSPAVIARTKAEIGPYAWAGQYQQSPSPRGGGIFQRAWWQLWESPDGRFPVFEYVVASLDSAFTEREQNDPSGFTIWGAFLNKDGRRRIMLVHAWRKHLQFSGPKIEMLPGETPQMYNLRTMAEWGLLEWVAYSCRRFKVDKLLIEAKASGISAAQVLQTLHGREGWAIELCPVKGDKVARALGVQATFSQQMIYAPDRDWAEMVIDEMAVFPKGKRDDLTDSTTQAIKHLRDNGIALTDDEVKAAEVDAVTHRSQPKAIYPV